MQVRQWLLGTLADQQNRFFVSHFFFSSWVFRHISLAFTSPISQVQSFLVDVHYSEEFTKDMLRGYEWCWEISCSCFGSILFWRVSNGSSLLLQKLWFCHRPATELFEAYNMKGMTFNPPVPSVTPRRKVIPFLTTGCTNVSFICYVQILAHSVWLSALCTFSVKYFLTGVR